MKMRGETHLSERQRRSYAHLLHPSVLGWYPNAVDIHPYKFVDLKPLDEFSVTKVSRNP